jgi:hypothetical protein
MTASWRDGFRNWSDPSDPRNLAHPGSPTGGAGPGFSKPPGPTQRPIPSPIPPPDSPAARHYPYQTALPKKPNDDQAPICPGAGVRPLGGTVANISHQRFSLQNYFGNHERRFPFTNHIGPSQFGSCIVEGTADSSQFRAPVCLRVFVRDSNNQNIGPTCGTIFPGVVTATNTAFSIAINNIRGSASAPNVYFQIDRLDFPKDPPPGFRDPYLALRVDIKDWRPGP